MGMDHPFRTLLVLHLLRRYRNGEKLSQAHRKHAYQRLNQSGWAHDKIVLYAMTVNMLLFSFVYFMPNIGAAFSLAVVSLPRRSWQ